MYNCLILGYILVYGNGFICPRILLQHLANNQSFTAKIEYRGIQFYKCMLSSENEKVWYIARW